jgi:hypothetical protein
MEASVRSLTGRIAGLARARSDWACTCSREGQILRYYRCQATINKRFNGSVSGSAQRLPVSIFCFTEGLCEGEQVVLKPVLAEVEQDTNEETPLASEAIFAEELAEATAAQGPGPARQVTALH